MLTTVKIFIPLTLALTISANFLLYIKILNKEKKF